MRSERLRTRRKEGRTGVSAILVLATFAFLFSCTPENISSGEEPLAIVSAKVSYSPDQVVILKPDASIASGQTNTFVLRNTGSMELEIVRVECSSPEVFTFNSTDIPGALMAGEKADFDLSFHPTSSGTYSARLVLVIAGTEKPIVFEIEGTVAEN